MTGRGEPPEGPPENPSGGEDEYRSLVFDESFVRAARLQEFSARERMGEPARAVRSLPRGGPRRRSRAAIALVVLIALAFATAVYIGFRNPYPTPVGRHAEPLRTTVIPPLRGARCPAEHLTSCSTKARRRNSGRAPRESTCRPSGGPRTSRTLR